jgi:hypothetical protein
MTGWTGDGPADALRVLLPAKTSKTPPERVLGTIELGGEPWRLEELSRRPAGERDVFVGATPQQGQPIDIAHAQT